MNKKISVKCSQCAKQWMKEVFDLKKWQGRCKSCAKIGNTIGKGNFGKPKSAIHSKRISVALIGKVRSKTHCLNISRAKTGIKQTISFSISLSKRMKGSSNHFYIDGRTSENVRIRHSHEYATWRKHVFNRDNYTCQKCKTRGGELNADHELPFAFYPDLRFEVLNGRTLCVPCHRQTATYGKKALSYLTN